MIPVFVCYFGRREMLDHCLWSLRERQLVNVTVIDNLGTLEDEPTFAGVKVVHSDNRFRHYAPWELGLVPDDRPYICTEEDIAISDDCPLYVADALLAALDANPTVPKIGLTIRTDVPEDCERRWSMSLAPERSCNERPAHGSPPIRDFPVDTHFAIHRAGVTRWPGIVGARLAEPYTCRHLPWYNAEPSEEEMAYYERCGAEWNRRHIGAPLTGMLPR